MGKTAPRTRTTTVTEKLEDDEDDAGSVPAWSESPLFAANDRRLKQIDHVAVLRKDPDSGYLGQMPVDLSEATLFSKWGGGMYRLEAKNALGQILPGAVRSVKLAGDPIFSSEIEEKRWRKLNGLSEGNGRPDGGALSAKDLLLVIEAKDEKRRAEQLDREDRLRAELDEREERERRAREERAAASQRDADERRAREQKEQEEKEDRRRREAREDDDRRSRIHREDMERLTQQNAQQLANSQQFFQQLATTLKSDTAAAAKAAPSADSGGAVMKALLTGLQIAREMGGDKAAAAGEPPDLLTSLVSRLPETLQEIRQTAAGAYRELTAKNRPAPTPAALPAQGKRKRRPDELTIRGPTGLKAKRLLYAIQQSGQDPEAALDRMLTMAASAVGVDVDGPAPAAPNDQGDQAEPAAAAVERTKRPRARRVVRTKQSARAAAARRPRKARA